jgi:outer membrane protein OmpA-like peptidoglycan-associated protein
MAKFIFSLIFGVSLILSSCATSGKTFTKARYKTNVYKGERGKTAVTVLNKKKAELEKKHIENLEQAERAFKILEEQKARFNSIDRSEQVSELDAMLINLTNEINDLLEQMKSIDPYSDSGFETGLKLGVQLNDLLYKRIIPMGMLIEENKVVNSVRADTDFKTGSYTLSKNGKSTIDNLVNEIIKDVEAWQKYLDHHNEAVFKTGKFKTKIIINGYADLQGSSSSNQTLSEKRAKSVEDEIRGKLDAISAKYNLFFDIDATGLGETVPPGVTPNGKNDDPARRITTIICVTGPSLLIK